MKYSPLKRNTLLKSTKGFSRSSSFIPLKKTRLRKSSPSQVEGIWSLTEADSKFSMYIRDRDKRCQKCGTNETLTCSHFNNREHSTTRFDPENNDTFCLLCHSEIEILKKPGQWYYEWKRNQLGETKFLALHERGKQEGNRLISIIGCMYLLKDFNIKEISW